MKVKILYLFISIIIIVSLSFLKDARVLASNPPLPSPIPIGTYDEWRMHNGELCYFVCTRLEYTDPLCSNNSIRCAAFAPPTNCIPPNPPPPVPACGSSCTPGATSCPLECPVCGGSSPTSVASEYTCGSAAVPTATPTTPVVRTPTPTVTRVPTPTGTRTPTPTVTRVLTPTGTRTPTPTVTRVLTPTPTPTTPPFSESMCRCDQITFEPTSFTAGSTLKVTAWAKIEGADTSYASVSQMIFSSYKAPNSDLTHPIRDFPYQNPMPVSIVENTSTKIRYVSTWDYKVPDVLDPAYTYQIRSAPKCVRKTAGVRYNSFIASSNNEIAVAPDASRDKGFFGSILSFFVNLFDSSKYSISQKIASVGKEKGDQLQLDTFTPATVTRTTCNLIEYKAK